MQDSRPRAVIYCRTASHCDSKDEHAIDAQRSLLREFARQQGFSEPIEFADNGFSGFSLDRPAFQRMNEALRTGGPQVLFIRDLSRISRSYMEYYHWRKSIQGLPVQIVSMQDRRLL